MKIMLDAGHGYNTQGKRSPNGMREWTFNAAVAALVRKALLKYRDVIIYMAHDEDGSTDISLQDRTDRANDLKVDLYLSIHANAYGSGWNGAEGIETFVYKSRPTGSLAIANKIQAELIKATGRKNRGVKAADYHVLRETHMDAVLTECGGFMTNKEEAALMLTDQYRQKVAAALVKALVDHYKLQLKPVAAPAPAAPSGGLYRVQVGAFAKKENAEALAADLKKKGYAAIIKQD